MRANIANKQIIMRIVVGCIDCLVMMLLVVASAAVTWLWWL
jgi:hypothetical protein